MTCGTSCPCSVFPILRPITAPVCYENSPRETQKLSVNPFAASPRFLLSGSSWAVPQELDLWIEASRSGRDSFIKTSLDYELSLSLLSVSVPSWSLRPFLLDTATGPTELIATLFSTPLGDASGHVQGLGSYTLTHLLYSRLVLKTEVPSLQRDHFR